MSFGQLWIQLSSLAGILDSLNISLFPDEGLCAASIEIRITGVYLKCLLSCAELPSEA